MEALVRCPHVSLAQSDILCAALFAWSGASLLKKRDISAALSAYLSLAATVRKLLLFIVPSAAEASAQARRQAQRPNLSIADQPGGPTDLLKRMQLLSDNQNMEPALADALSELNRLHNTCMNSSPDASAVGLDSQIDPSKLFLVHQLQATLCLSLVQVFRWRVVPTASYYNDVRWLPAAVQTFQKLPTQDLTDLMISAVRTVFPALTHKEINTLWERYAVAHLHGRLTLGCCHLGCTNLTGASEAVLPTLTCSRCKLARYCSVECQRAAWKEGGHSTVCGK